MSPDLLGVSRHVASVSLSVTWQSDHRGPEEPERLRGGWEPCGLGMGADGRGAQGRPQADAGVFILFHSTLHPPPNPVAENVAVETKGAELESLDLALGNVTLWCLLSRRTAEVSAQGVGWLLRRLRVTLRARPAPCRGHADHDRPGAGAVLPLLAPQTLQETDSKQLSTQSSGHSKGDDRVDSDSGSLASSGWTPRASWKKGHLS